MKESHSLAEKGVTLATIRDTCLGARPASILEQEQKR